jgi:hypothetical protein
MRVGVRGMGWSGDGVEGQCVGRIGADDGSGRGTRDLDREPFPNELDTGFSYLLTLEAEAAPITLRSGLGLFDR